MSEVLDPTIKEFYEGRRVNQTDVTRKEGTLLHNKKPTITVLLSGGGIRAMESSVHFMDFLKRDGILDNVQTVGGLSGGSWTCIVGGMAGERSKFHSQDTPHHPWSRDSKETITAVIDENHPLVHMLSQENAEDARQAVISSRASSYIKTSVWSDILIDSLQSLDFLLKTQGFCKKDVDGLFHTITGDRRYSTLMNFSSMLGYQLLGEDPEIEVNQQHLQQHSGHDLPLFLAAAVSETSPDQFQWYVFDGLGNTGAIRRLDPLSPHNSPITRTNLEELSWRSCSGNKWHFEPHLLKFWKTKLQEPVFKNFPLITRRVIGICGSALGMYTKQMKLLDGEGFRAQIKKNDEHFAELVDAGIHNNVPFPLALKGSQELQEHNIAIVLDNSYGADGPAELLNAVKQGYYHPMCTESDLTKSFFKGNKPTVKIFFPHEDHKNTDPIIIYAMGDVKQLTSRFDRTYDEIKNNRAYISSVAQLVKDALEFLLNTPSKELKRRGGVIDIEEVKEEERRKQEEKLKPPLQQGSKSWFGSFMSVANALTNPLMLAGSLMATAVDSAPAPPATAQPHDDTGSVAGVHAWQDFPTLFDAMASMEKLFLDKNNTSASEIREEAIRLFGYDDATTSPEEFAKAATYQAFVWAASAVDALENGEQLTDQVIAELASRLNFSVKREQKVLQALFFFATKVQMLAATDDDLKPKVIELVQAFKKHFAAQARAVAAAEHITISTNAISAEDVVSEVTKFVKNAGAEKTHFAAALQKRVDIYNTFTVDHEE